MSLKQNDIWGENLLDNKIGTFHRKIPDKDCVCPLCEYGREKENKNKELVKEIMQEGFECAMTGDIFKTDEENEIIRNKLYTDTVDKYTKVIGGITHHASGFNYCEECKKLATEEGLIK